MSINSIFLFIIIGIIIYLFFKFIVSPFIRFAVSLLVILIIIYISSRFFGFDTDTAFGQFGKYLNIKNWPFSSFVTVYIDMIINWLIFTYKYLAEKISK